MPKMKTHSGAKKRFSKTGTGKVKRNQSKRQHLQRKLTTKAKRNLSGTVIVCDAEVKRIKRMLVK